MKDTDHRPQRRLQEVALSVVPLVLLGWAWSFASPLGSAPDDGFHMTSIWCAWGESDSCVMGAQPGEVLVPDRVANSSCFALGGSPNAGCTVSLTGKLIPTIDLNASIGYNPRVFYLTLRALVGHNEAVSVLLIRMFNVVLAAILLGFALLVSRPEIRRALALTWGIAIVPVGIFTIASTNPSSWAIIGVGVFWAFFYTLLTEPSWRSGRALLAALGSVISLVIALGGRSDPAYVIVLSMMGAAVLAYPQLRSRAGAALPKIAVGIAIVIGILVVSWTSRAGSFARALDQLRFPPGSEANDQPAAVLKTLGEFPAFMAGMLGGQTPSWDQRSSPEDAGLAGYSWHGFTYGLGYTDVALPSLVWILLTVCVGGVLINALTSSQTRKLVAVGILFMGIVAEVLVVRSVYAFEPGIGALQPRYFYPLVLVTICFAVIPPIDGKQSLNRTQASALVLALTVINVVAIRATMASYIHGQGHSWTQLADQPSWWWSFGPSPDQLTMLAAFVGFLWFFAAVAIFRGNWAMRNHPQSVRVTPTLT